MSHRKSRTLMLVAVSLTAGIAFTLLVQKYAVLGVALAAEARDLSVPHAWSLTSLATMALERGPDRDPARVVSGTPRTNVKTLNEGENHLELWDAGPAKYHTVNPFPYDEVVLILKGKLILTDKDGKSAAYEKGDVFVVPKGFTGYWDMTEEYRELVVIKGRS